MNITVTEFKVHLSKCLNSIFKEPIISHEEYEQFTRLEDEIWALRALEAQESGYVNNAMEKLQQVAKDKI